MDVFIKEPLIDWEKFARRVSKEQGGDGKMICLLFDCSKTPRGKHGFPKKKLPSQKGS
jgi:hypothetical protein